MAEDDKLKEYKGKRNFSKTPEPKERSKKSFKRPIFVIQQHDARRNPVSTEPESLLSSKTIEEMAEAMP
jgi:hypothetical protein